MAKYCQEKFEREDTGAEQSVCWRQDKHVHDAAMITAVEKWLGQQQGGTWSVRANSYQSNLQSCSVNALEYDG